MSYAPILTDSPVGFWPLTDTSGATCAALAGSDAAIVGASYTRSADQIGVYDGNLVLTLQTSDTRVVTVDTSNYATFSVEVGFNADSLAAQQTLISKGGYYAPSVESFPFSLVLNTDGSLQVNLSSGDNFSYDATIVSASGLVAAGVPHHVGYIHRNSGLCELYLDGVSVASQTIGFALSSSTYGWTFGAPAYPYSSGANTIGFKGRLVGAALFSGALSGDRVAAHADLMTVVPTTGAAASVVSPSFGIPLASYDQLCTAFSQQSTIFGTVTATNIYVPRNIVARQYGSVARSTFGTPHRPNTYLASSIPTHRIGPPKATFRAVSHVVASVARPTIGQPYCNQSHLVRSISSGSRIGKPRAILNKFTCMVSSLPSPTIGTPLLGAPVCMVSSLPSPTFGTPTALPHVVGVVAATPRPRIGRPSTAATLPVRTLAVLTRQDELTITRRSAP